MLANGVSNSFPLNVKYVLTKNALTPINLWVDNFDLVKSRTKVAWTNVTCDLLKMVPQNLTRNFVKIMSVISVSIEGGKMSPGQMLPKKMSLRQLLLIDYSPRNLTLKFCQN